MEERDELDWLRKPREKVIYRDQPVLTWTRALTFGLLVLVTLCVASLINDIGWKTFLLWFFCGLAVIPIAGGGSLESDTLITEDRVLRLGKLRGVWNRRRDSGYVAELAKITGVALIDTGGYLTVEVRHAGGDRVDVLGSNQPQAMAAAIARGAGLAEPPRVGRVEHVAEVCNVIGLGASLNSMPHIFDAVFSGALDQGPIREFVASSTILSVSFEVGQFAAIAVLMILVSVLAQLIAALFAMLAMPLYASAEEAANWFSLKPSRRLFRWFGWKSRPYRWLAERAYRADLEVRA